MVPLRDLLIFLFIFFAVYGAIVGGRNGYAISLVFLVLLAVTRIEAVLFLIIVYFFIYIYRVRLTMGRVVFVAAMLPVSVYALYFVSGYIAIQGIGMDFLSGKGFLDVLHFAIRARFMRQFRADGSDTAVISQDEFDLYQLHELMPMFFVLFILVLFFTSCIRYSFEWLDRLSSFLQKQSFT